MYLLNTQVKIDWVLPETDSILVQADFSLITTTPEESVSYVPIINFIAPTSRSEGLITHFFTPDTEGLWEINMVKGATETYTEINKVTFYVFSNITEVNPVDYSSGSLDILGV